MSLQIHQPLHVTAPNFTKTTSPHWGILTCSTCLSHPSRRDIFCFKSSRWWFRKWRFSFQLLPSSSIPSPSETTKNALFLGLENHFQVRRRLPVKKGYQQGPTRGCNLSLTTTLISQTWVRYEHYFELIQLKQPYWKFLDPLELKQIPMTKAPWKLRKIMIWIAAKTLNLWSVPPYSTETNAVPSPFFSQQLQTSRMCHMKPTALNSRDISNQRQDIGHLRVDNGP